MSKKVKQKRPAARLPKGLRDIEADEVLAGQAMIAKIRAVYESYGFEPLETPAFEFTDALGKFLPDSDRPNEGVFSFQDEDDQWLSLRYDLTAPLARYVAQNFDQLPKPFRRYAVGPVWRNEKPGPGRFRQFMQFDADTVGTESVAADAEMCMLAADTFQALGFQRGEYGVRVSNRKLLDGVLDVVCGDGAQEQRLKVLRAIDKYDRLGSAGVEALLGAGRKDESGDYTSGAQLDGSSTAKVMEMVNAFEAGSAELLKVVETLIEGSERGKEGFAELDKIADFIEAGGYADCVFINPSVVRGLEYYTGPVFEAELTFDVKSDDGQVVRFGSVGGGGRYDDLVTRFTGRAAPATGFSIGVSRLQAALNALDRSTGQNRLGAVVVLVMDYDDVARYQTMVQELRSAGVRAEMYLGTSGMKAQMKYADKRRAPCVVIEGSDERDKGEVQIKDLIEGTKASESISDNKEWKEVRPAQFSVKRDDLVAEVRKVCDRHR